MWPVRPELFPSEPSQCDELDLSHDGGMNTSSSNPSGDASSQAPETSPDDDLRIETVEGGRRLLHKDGTPYGW